MKKDRLLLERLTPGDADGIYGRLRVADISEAQTQARWYDTLERPWLDNEVGVSAIPAGVYPLRKYKFGEFLASYKRRWQHQFVLEVGDVPGRSAILFHTGNEIDDSEGCILLGHREPGTKGKFIYRSRDAYADFFSKVEDLYFEYEQLTLEIRNAEDK